MKQWIAGMCLVTLTGCAAQQEVNSWVGAKFTAGCGAPLTQEQQLSMNLALDMAQEGKRHAALAHFEQMPANLPLVRLNKAKVLRQLNQPGAAELYSSLLNTCLAADGHQGLGQLAFAKGDIGRALEHLNAAVTRLPTDASMRNDYALALMAHGDPAQAHFEFVTALELNPNAKITAINLVSLLLMQNKWDEAAALSARMGLSADNMRSAKQQAEQYRQPQVAAQSVPTVAEPTVSPTPSTPAAPTSSVTAADIARALSATLEQP